MAKLSFEHGGVAFRCSLAALMVLVAVWTGWQAMVPAPESDAALPQAAKAPLLPVASTTRQADAAYQAEVQRLVAEVATVCPTSAMQLEQELLSSPTPRPLASSSGAVAPKVDLTAHHQVHAGATQSSKIQPSATITSIRVAQNSRPQRIAPQRIAMGSNPSQGGGNWLVDPNAWYAPEDAAANAGSVSSEPTLEPADSDATSPAVEAAPSEPAAAPVTPEESNSITPDRIQRSPPLPVEASPPPGEHGPSLVRPVETAPATSPEPSIPPKTDATPRRIAPPPAEPAIAPPVVEQPPMEQAPVEQTPVEQPAVPKAQMWVESPKTQATESQSPNTQSPNTQPAAPVQRESLPTPPADRPSAPAAPQSAPTTVSPPAPTTGPAVSPTAPSTFAPPAAPNLHASGSEADRASAWAQARAAGVPEGLDPHLELVAEGCFPSAKTCAKCHEKIYNEWSCSSHAYANISPMFQKFEQRITEVSQGTIGYFCLRCHAPVGTTMGLSRDLPLWEQPAVAREGITCVACHRVNQRYVKTNGERRLVPGDEFAAIYGGKRGEGVAEAIAHKDQYKVKTSADDKGPGQNIHVEGRYFDQLSQAEYCTTCHQVAVHPGIKLEVVWEQYRASPAYRQGITCQDCHMGKVPGLPSGYECCAIAEVGGKTVRDNVKHSNHVFYGPGYSIAHPGIFPFHVKADRWSIPEWLEFDWRAGWGTDEFEDRVADGETQVRFPKAWVEADDRYDAREIIDDNLKRLEGKTEIRKQVMENGSHVDGPFFDCTPSVGQDLDLHYVVTNTNTGHNLPTASLGAQPQLWANIVLIGPSGQRLWETGYTDRYGDVCDIHSRDVRAGLMPFDSQLFNLQTMFLITGAVGTDREFYLPVNVEFDQLPFLRPGAIPVSVTNHPPFIRMESRSLAPLGRKKVNYKIPGELLCQPGRYRLSFRMRSRAEPIYFMDFCRATTEMKRGMNEGIVDIHPYAVEFTVQ
ncbi:multiheme c-type cytochrome [Aeoliella mucimassa]|uniref:Cytochrome c-552/4 domain-containing protein n=1 Tax=Aeoliella mucimassa TaxID=2527972 RepID=A0A518AKB1_9BACT|nr:multiheme c-type cytochrome [Aeoliella mucimassa]QDU55169.1 hypothetical protein Pan181_13550 [Aeoliella mucimassa]